MITTVKKILPLFKNFYFSTGLFFIIWISAFDANDVISQIRLTSKLHDLEREKEYYLNKIEEVHLERAELLSSNALLEKFARERYLMKKPTEDVYIVEDQN